ncbi:hypothetical protein [Streptomyces sp. NPDC091027]|uniref:hypothetical protein n=1 Tax=Streptomyces sp. NPDC091027 TaxID=3365971 RepID=UPI00382C2120
MDRIRGMRTTASRWVRGGAAVVCGALLTACAASGESGGAAGATAPAPASTPPPAAAPPSAAPAGGDRLDEDMLSDEFGPGVNSWFGTLEADTPYWIRAWQLVPEGADLSRARLCEARPAAGTENCVPVGEVRSGDAALPGAG